MAIGPIRPMVPDPQPPTAAANGNSPKRTPQPAEPKPDPAATPDPIVKTYAQIRIEGTRVHVTVVNAETNEVLLDYPPEALTGLSELLNRASQRLQVDA